MVVCAVVFAPFCAVITSMPLPLVSAPRPPMLVICTVVLPLAEAAGPLRISRSEGGPLKYSVVPSLSTPPLPTYAPFTVSVVPGTVPTSDTVPLLLSEATVWL